MGLRGTPITLSLRKGFLRPEKVKPLVHMKPIADFGYP